MIHTQVVLRQKKRKDNTFPLAIRITEGKKVSYIYTGDCIEEKYWDKQNHRVRKSYPNSERLNNLLTKKVAEINKEKHDLGLQDKIVAPHTIKQQVKKTKKSQLFFDQADVYIANFKKAGKFNRFSPDESRLKNLEEFLGRRDSTFQEITVPLLKQFRAYLESKEKDGIRTNGERSIINHFIIIRTIFNQAIGSETLDRKYYPFGKGKIQIKIPDSIKIGLTEKEVKQLESFAIPKHFNRMIKARNIWLFSFYFAGMRVSDVLRLRWSDFQNDRLYYTMGKNAKPGSLGIPSKAIAIIEQYKNEKRSDDDYIFPALKGVSDNESTLTIQKRIADMVNGYDKSLKSLSDLIGINKKITMHLARHTFGNLSGDKIPIQMLQKLYRHGDIRTTLGYQANFIFKDADDALEAVVGK